MKTLPDNGDQESAKTNPVNYKSVFIRKKELKETHQFNKSLHMKRRKSRAEPEEPLNHHVT